MIEINERFEVAAPPAEVYKVLSDPHAVVECIAGAALGEQHEDGSYDGTMTVKFSALRVRFAGRVSLELDEEAHRGTVHASGKDGQGGTKFKATASFEVQDSGDGSLVTATGEVALAGKLASMIEGAATAVVKRMTGEFVEALSVRCASGSADLGPAPAATTEAVSPDEPAAAVPAVPSIGVLLLHDFGAAPHGVRPWGEALAATGMAVRIPRLPGHGTRWKDLNTTTWTQWLAAAESELTSLRETSDQVFVMGLSMGAVLALRLAEDHPEQVAGVVAVNPVVTGLTGVSTTSLAMRWLFRTRPAVVGDVKRAGVTDVGYDRIPLRAARSLAELARTTLAGLGRVGTRVLLATSTDDHVVAASDGELVWNALTSADKRRITFEDSYHVVSLDNDATQLFGESISFVRSRVEAVR